MATWINITRLFRGRVREAADNVIDANLATVIDEALIDHQRELQASRQALARLMAERKQLAQTLVSNREKAAQIRAWLADTLNTPPETTAEPVDVEGAADRLLEIEDDIAAQQQLLVAMQQKETQYRRRTEQAADDIRRMKQEQSLLRASERMRKLAGSLDSSLDNPLANTRGQLAILRERQNRRMLESESLDELTQAPEPDRQVDKATRAARRAALLASLQKPSNPEA